MVELFVPPSRYVGAGEAVGLAQKHTALYHYCCSLQTPFLSISPVSLDESLRQAAGIAVLSKRVRVHETLAGVGVGSAAF